VSVLVKEALYQITARIGKKQGSQVLIANAWHHRRYLITSSFLRSNSTHSDAISSIVALIGVAGAELGLSVLDPIAVLILTEILSLLMDWQGLAVAVLIAKSGFDSVWSSAKVLRVYTALVS
jgi:divalent metal cation (Fe/Co/Zn/Cd) transporter